jgi:alpha-beta hydrolase superfamily lysophospholipase
VIGLLRRVVPPFFYAGLGCLAAAVAAYVHFLENQPDLKPWHLANLSAEFRAADAARVADLDGYRRLEDRLFAELREEVYARVGSEDRSVANRFWRGSRTDPEGFPTNWNRTFELPRAEPAAGALLLHGLSDSPYSLRAIGRLMHGQGAHVVGLRLPGHGTAPAGLLDVTAADWRAAVRLAALDLRAKIGPDRPFVLVGYSNGAALAVDHALAVLEGGEDLPRVDGLVLLSAAIEVSPAAALARYQAALSRLTGLGKLAWTAIQPEFDPYKYNSFTVNAEAQIHALTSTIAARLDRLAPSGKLAGFPRVLAFQSAVDATIPPGAVVVGLLGRLPPGGDHELVLFDVNRDSETELLLKEDPEGLAARLLGNAAGNPFTLDLVTNTGDGSDSVVVRRRPAGPRAVVTEERQPFAWPRGLFSLSHVALPFPPDDPVYGGPEGREAGGRHLTLGAVTLLGERGALLVPDGFFVRLRYNPFFPYLERRVRGFTARVQGKATPPSRGPATGRP